MLNELLGILLITLSAIAALLAAAALWLAIPGIRRWAREGGKPTPVHVTVPVTMPTANADSDASAPSPAFAIPSAAAAPRTAQPAIDVRLEACTEVLGTSSSAGPVRTVQLVIENVGNAPAFALKLEPTPGESAKCFDAMDCRTVLKREIPALAAGRELRFKAGQHDAITKALGGESLPVQPTLNLRFASTFADTNDENLTKATITVSTHGMESSAVSTNHAPSKPPARNPFKPLGK